MLLSETLCDMNTRQIAGSIIRDELARQGMKHEKAAQRMGVARSTLSRVIEGNGSVRPETLRAVEGLLGFPRRFLDFVVNGDVLRISHLVDMDPDLRRHTLDVLRDVGHDEDPTRGRKRHV